jgi:hypothetical protein
MKRPNRKDYIQKASIIQLLADLEMYIDYLEAQNQALTIPVVTSTLPNIDSTEFRDWLKSELFEQTLNRFLYKRGGFEYDKDVLYQHYANQLQFGN